MLLRMWTLRKRVRYVRWCKDVLRSCWTTEYIRSLRERNNLKHKARELTLKVGDVVLIQSDERNHGNWSIGIAVKLIKGCAQSHARSQADSREAIFGASDPTFMSNGAVL